MRLKNSIYFILILCASLFIANNAAAQSGPVCEAPSGYDCWYVSTTGSDSNAGSYASPFRTLGHALGIMSGGDHIYLRGGVYQEGSVVLPLGKDGNINAWSTIKSYPGEWAVLDGANSTAGYILGYSCYEKTNDSCYHAYWKIEHMEFRNSDRDGIFLSGGPFIIRYNYFHDIITPNGGEGEPGAVKGTLWHDSVVEYNYFLNNGCPDNQVNTNNCAHLNMVADYSYYRGWDWRTNGVQYIDFALKRNKFRYNIFENTMDLNRHGIKYKEHQTLTPLYRDLISMQYKDYGDEINNNIFLNIDSFGIYAYQDFIQVHHNILINNSIAIGEERLFTCAWGDFYNNYISNGKITASWNANYAPYEPLIYTHIYNNIIDQGIQTWNENQITISPDTHNSVTNIDMSTVHVDNNYLYRPQTGYRQTHYMVARGSAAQAEYSTSGYNNQFAVGNYYKESSEGSDPLLQSGTYKTRTSHSVSGGTSLGNGGHGGSHPYLDGRSIPQYIGPCPDDQCSWVDEVMELRDPANLIEGETGAAGPFCGNSMCETGETCSTCPADCGSCSNCHDGDNDGYDNCSPGQNGDDGNEIDCDDSEYHAHPGGTETCDTLDNDCDNQIDENCDNDNDGYCDAGEPMYRNNSMCPNTGFFQEGQNGDDCDDNNANVHPGAVEVCGNFVDEDCSGSDLSCSGSSCHQLSHGSFIPPGFGAPYNAISLNHEQLIEVNCNNESISLSVGNNSNTQYIYRYAYIWRNNSWQQIALTGSYPSYANSWFRGRAIADYSLTAQEMAAQNRVLVYICNWDHNTWKCGCRDSDCAHSYWQIQQF